MKYGLYEQIINLKIKENLCNISERYKQIEPIDKAEASKILSDYIADVVRQTLDDMDNDDVQNKVSLINKIISTIQNERVINGNSIRLLFLHHCQKYKLAVYNQILDLVGE